jgi:CBS domain-containing protein
MRAESEEKSRDSTHDVTKRGQHEGAKGRKDSNFENPSGAAMTNPTGSISAHEPGRSDSRHIMRGPKKAKTPRNQAKLLKDIMTREVEVIGPEATLQETAAWMDACGIGFLPVCDNDRLVGVLTDRDIAVRAVAAGSDPKDTRVRDVMTPDVVYTFEEQDVVQAARMIEENQIRRLIVLNSDRRLVGVVSLDDLATSARDKKLAGIVLERVSKPIL